MFNEINIFDSQPWIVAAGEMIADADLIGDLMGYVLSDNETGQQYPLDGEQVAKIGKAELELAMAHVSFLKTCYELEAA